MSNLNTSLSLSGINSDLDNNDSAYFEVIGGRRTGTFAEVSLLNLNGHETQMTVTASGRVGRATIYRSRGAYISVEQLTVEQLWSAFGSAYARAVDAPQAGGTAQVSGPIELGDFVEVATSYGITRGIVVDYYSSVRNPDNGSVVVQRATGAELTFDRSNVTLIAKGT